MGGGDKGQRYIRHFPAVSPFDLQEFPCFVYFLGRFRSRDSYVPVRVSKLTYTYRLVKSESVFLSFLLYLLPSFFLVSVAPFFFRSRWSKVLPCQREKSEGE
jgi:hypothetical protein